MYIVKSISVLLGGGKRVYKTHLPWTWPDFSVLWDILCISQKTDLWIFKTGSFILGATFVALPFAKQTGIKRKGSSFMVLTNGGRKLIWMSVGDSPPPLQLYIIYWFFRFSHNSVIIIIGQNSTSLSWREVWVGVENKDLKYMYHSRFGPSADAPWLACRIWNCCMGGRHSNSTSSPTEVW